MRYANRFLLRFGWMLVPEPTSPKMLEEHANVSECHHPSRGGNTVKWMRHVSMMMLQAGVHRHGRDTG